MSMNQYIYIYQDCTIDNSNDHKRHLKRQVRFELSIPIAANSTQAVIRLLLCQLAKHPPVVGDDSPGQTPHVN